MGTNQKCGGCLWYEAPDHGEKLGECKNAQSPVYWNQGDDRKVVRIAPSAEPCLYYKSAGVLLGEGTCGARGWGGGLAALVRTGLYQLAYPLVMTGLFFYCVFFGSTESYDTGCTRPDTERLLL